MQADLQKLIAGLTGEELKAFDASIAAELQRPWLPNAGPQTQAMLSKADILLYGGAAGGGKTDLILGLAVTEHERTVVFRRAYTDIRGLEERLIELIGRQGYNGQDKVMRRDGRLIEFGALEKPGAELGWQGRPHDLICFDEGAQLSAAKVKFVLGWLRSTTPGQRCRVVIGSNPPMGGEGDWLLDWFAPWLDPVFPEPAEYGELRWAITARDEGGTPIWVPGPGWYVQLGDRAARAASDGEVADGREGKGDAVEALSRTFIPSRLSDNPYLANTSYRAQLQSLEEPFRSKLLLGDFLAGREDAPDQVIPSAWVDAAFERWKKAPPAQNAKMLALGVDIAQGGPDKTVLAPLYGTTYGELIRRKGVDTKNGPAVAALVIETMRDRCQITMDLTGGWGGSARDHLQGLSIPVMGVVFSQSSQERTRDGKFGFLNARAEMYWKFREALDPIKGEGIALPPDKGLKAQLTAHRWKLKGDRIQIESKDELKDRLGASPDDSDAVVLAWHKRDAALYVQRNDTAPQFYEMQDPFG